MVRTLLTAPGPDCPPVFRDEELPRAAAQLRGAYGRHVGEPVWETFVHRLCAASPFFARLRESGDVVPPGPHVETFRHEAAGEIRMASVSLSVNGMPECRIVACTPDDEESLQRMESLNRHNRKSRPLLKEEPGS
ncbi:hypothetical protein GCM10010446_46400 [Streptomyces enissocaesilis]|uniref:MmyB-like transcription regulator ligand binding domain-containing protein n=1 Tax=Streptomyces enissocaesilis TaxID=332589 RepID=A0ABP6JYV8_9ACTN